MKSNFIPVLFRALLLASLVSYLTSLFLPGLIYKSPYYPNGWEVNYQTALGIARQGSECWAVSGLFRLTANGVEKTEPRNPSVIEPERQSWYCTGNDAALRFAQPGRYILLIGWAEIAGGGEAWCANIIGAFSLMTAIAAWPSTRRGFLALGAKMILSTTGSITACCAFWLGLSADRFRSMPVNEGGAYLVVDRLGPGFYVWEASFLLLGLALFCGSWAQWGAMDSHPAGSR